MTFLTLRAGNFFKWLSSQSYPEKMYQFTLQNALVFRVQSFDLRMLIIRKLYSQFQVHVYPGIGIKVCGDGGCGYM